jgi:transposase
MTRPYSVAFKQKMIQRLTGKGALSASQLARRTGVRQQNLSRWLEDARSLPRTWRMAAAAQGANTL